MKKTVATTVHGTDETSSVRTFEVDETAELPTMADIYKSEINVSIVTDWDAGYDWKLHGSPYTGEWVYTGNTRTFDDAVLAIRTTFKAIFEPTGEDPAVAAAEISELLHSNPWDDKASAKDPCDWCNERGGELTKAAPDSNEMICPTCQATIARAAILSALPE